MKILKLIDEKLSVVENILLVAFLCIMILLAFLLVVLRNVFNTGIFGADEFLRHLVLLSAFIGAAQGARLQRHINVDVLTKFMKDGHKRIAGVFINLFSFIVVLMLARASWLFVMSEKEFSETIWGIRTWVFELVIPVGFFLIGYRFLLHFITGITTLIRKKKS